MRFEPDIFVTAADSPHILLVVEAKLRFQDFDKIEADLKRYMTKMGAPIGLLVSPRQFALYRDRYTGHSEESVDRIGLFDVPKDWEVLHQLHTTGEALEQGNRDAGRAFEDSVQNWLERLRGGAEMTEFSGEARESLSDYVLPVLTAGIIRGAQPRNYSAG